MAMVRRLTRLLAFLAALPAALVVAPATASATASAGFAASLPARESLRCGQFTTARIATMTASSLRPNVVGKDSDASSAAAGRKASSTAASRWDCGSSVLRSSPGDEHGDAITDVVPGESGRGGVDEEAHRIGFLGFGTIAKAIASGLLDHTSGRLLLRGPVRITHRSRPVSSEFVASRPDDGVVIVCDSNAEVVDNADVVFVCVLPQQMEKVVKGSEWDGERHVLVSLASTTTLEELTEWSGLPEDRVFRMICLPRVAKADSVSLVCPVPSSKYKPGVNNSASNPIGAILSICQSLGGYVPCSTQEDMRTLMAVTGLMGPLYGIMRRNVQWLVDRGVPNDGAGKFVAGMYASMAGDALEKSGANSRAGSDGARFLDDLIDEQTKGGLNEGALRHVEGEGVLDAYDEAMSQILTRLEGGSKKGRESFSSEEEE